MYGERASRLPGAVVWHQEPVAAGQVQRILPDGCMDLMWYGDQLMVAGPDSTAYVAPAPPGTAYAGVRFPPGIGPVVFGVPAWELRDQRVPMDDLWPAGEVRRLAEQVHLAPDPGAALEEIAAARHPVPDRLIGEVAARLRAGEPVRATAAAVGLSDRQLYRRSLAAFGYGPKTLARIMRMLRALELARAGTAFAAVAAAAGYADQAHLAREVKDLAGVPLSALVR